MKLALQLFQVVSVPTLETIKTLATTVTGGVVQFTPHYMDISGSCPTIIVVFPDSSTINKLAILFVAFKINILILKQLSFSFIEHHVLLLAEAIKLVTNDVSHYLIVRD